MKKISKIIGSVLITAAAVCLGIGVYQFTKEQNAGKGYQDLSEEVKKEPEDEGSKSKVDIPIDFAALKEKNPDVYDSRHLLRSFDFTDKEVYQQYLYRIFAIRDMNASIDTTAQVGTDDKILTLSTCYANQPDMRFLVQAVLVSIEQ